MDFHTLVINVKENKSRLETVEKALGNKGIDFEIVTAITPANLPNDFIGNMTPISVAVWSSHLKCLEIASARQNPTLIIEDDAEISLTRGEVNRIVRSMHDHQISFLQIGFLYLNPIDRFSVAIRNFYDKVIRTGFFAGMLNTMGFKEALRASSQNWRKVLPKNFILNDIRYGAHCYAVTPELALKMCQLNNPPFLSADDFYVSLSRMKSFRMARLNWSRANQSGAKSSFDRRYGIDLS